MSLALLRPEWPLAPRVRAFATTRLGGCSEPPYDGLNLGAHVGDDPAAVAANRELLARLLPAEPMWLDQVHGTEVVVHRDCAVPPRADAAMTSEPGRVCAVLTADCLPVLFCDRDATVVAAAHAGWRGLLAGILEKTVAALDVPAHSVRAWLGPAIGPAAFEVGDEVRQAFLARSPSDASAFSSTRRSGKWLADLYRLARHRLATVGVGEVYGGGLCTHGDPERFFSYRRDGRTGRQATLIWLAAAESEGGPF